MANSVPRRSRFALALTIIVLLGGATRAGMAVLRPMWEDEISRWTWTHGCEVVPYQDVTGPMLCHNRPPADFRAVLGVTWEKEPIVMPLLMNAWLRATGVTSDVGGRVPVVLFGVLAIVATAAVARRLLGDRAGLAAAAIVAASPLWIYYGSEFNNYALAAGLVAVSYVFYLRWIAEARITDGIAYALCILCASLTHYYVLGVFGAQATGCLVGVGASRRRIARALVPFLVVAVALAAYAPVAARQVSHMGSMGAGTFGGVPLLLARLRDVPLNPWLWQLTDHLPGALAGCVALVIVAFCLWGLAAVPAARLRLVVAINTVAPIAVLVLAYWVTGKNQLLWSRYGLFFTIMPIVAIAGIWAGPFGRPQLVAGVVAALLLGSGATFLALGTWQRDWRAAARLIAQDGAPGDVVLVHYPHLAYTLGRYLPAPQRMVPIGAGETLAAQVDAALVGRSGAWAVFAWDEAEHVRDLVDADLRCRFAERREYPLYGIKLVAYRGDPYSEARPSPDCGPDNGFAVDGECVVEPDGQLAVRGWVAAAPDARVEVLVNGAPVASATDGAAVDGVVAPASARWFTVDVPATAIAEGSLATVGVRVAEAGGLAATARRVLTCVRRSRIAMTGTRAARNGAGFVGTPGDRRRVAAGRPIAVDGWTFSTKGIAAIAILVDGVEIARTRRHGIARADVAAAHPRVKPALALHSGFAATVDTAGLRPGKHTLTLAVVHPDGTSSPLPPRKRFVIREAGGADHDGARAESRP